MPLDTLVRPQPSEATPAQEQARLLAGYAAAAAPFDEMLAPDGTFRPHWQRFVEGFAALGPDGRAAAAESTRRLLRESGLNFTTADSMNEGAERVVALAGASLGAGRDKAVRA